MAIGNEYECRIVTDSNRIIQSSQPASKKQTYLSKSIIKKKLTQCSGYILKTTTNQITRRLTISQLAVCWSLSVCMSVTVSLSVCFPVSVCSPFL